MEKIFTKKLKTILQSRYLIKGICLGILIYSFCLILFFPYQSKYQGNETTITGMIIKYQIEKEKITLYLKAKEKILVNYYKKEESIKNWISQNIELGQTVTVKGNLKVPSNNTIPNQFNYKNYLKHQKIFYIMNANSIEIKKQNVNVFYALKNKMIKRIDKIDKTGYLRTFILGDKSKLEEETLELYQKNGVSHLFSISGMHVSLITGILLLFLNKITYNNRYKYSIISIFLIVYLFLTDVSASILRTTIMFLLFSLNRCFNLKMKAFDIMLLTLTFALMIRPFLLCDVGFQFSYVISASLVIQRKYIQKIKNKFFQNLYLSTLCFIVSIPICLSHFGKINFLSIIFNLIMIPIVSTIIFPVTFIVFIFPFFFPFYEKLIWVLENLNLFFSAIDLLEVIFRRPNSFIICIYIIVISLTFIQKKFGIVLLFLLILHYYFPYFDGKFIMTILDQTTPNMIQGLKGIFARKPLISRGI